MIRLLLIPMALFAVASEAEEILPLEFPVSRYAENWKNSPFNREVVKPVEAVKPESAFGRGLTLEGLVHDAKIGPIAYLRSAEADELLIVTKQRKESVPFRILEAIRSNNPMETEVTITDGREEAVIKFASDLYSRQPIPQAEPPEPEEKTGNAPKKDSAPESDAAEERRIIIPTLPAATEPQEP